MKLTNLHLENFRSFTDFRLTRLGRINLLVGTNNCGKTTILEAIQILAASGDLSAIWSTLARRGEDIYGERDPNKGNSVRQVDIRRLFRGHDIEIGKYFRISSDSDLGEMEITARIDEFRPAQQLLFDTEPQPVDSPDDFVPPLSLILQWSHGPLVEIGIPLSRVGGISNAVIRRSPEATRRTSNRIVDTEQCPVRFITASALSAETVPLLYEGIVLTPEEDLVLEAMRLLEPTIERIAPAGSERFRAGFSGQARGGLQVRLKDLNRIPIGSLGDGIWRMLGLALAVVQSKNGILLVDEIDTGLHHTVMQDMWQFLYMCAQKYNVQIIATTHSRDCYHSLAVICRDYVSDGSDVTISRIERGRPEAVEYSEQEIVAAADRDIEVR